MKKIVLSLFLILVAVSVSAQQKFKIDHGPYLQELTDNGSTFVFTTSLPGFSCIEIKELGSEKLRTCYNIKHGMKQANNTFNAIRVEDLKPNTEYAYRICAKEVVTYEPYKIVYGAEENSRWYTFKTLNPKSKNSSFFVTSDIHDRPYLLEELLRIAKYETCDAMFYVGDIMSYMQSEESPFTNFIDKSVELFASQKPFILVRGNHETRGHLAWNFPHFYPKRDEKLYGSYRIGDIIVVMLDSGEDKPDSTPVYAGIADFDAYRTEQAEWLKQLVQTKEFKQARHRFVMVHFPAFIEHEGDELYHGSNDMTKKILPILNNADIDLMISGHTHEFAYHKPDKKSNHFPILVGSDHSAARIDIEKNKIKIYAFDSDGNELLKEELNK